MQDFDDHIADQLNHEGQFPNRSRNWRQLSRRLDALDTGLQSARPRLRIWQAIAAAAIVSTGVLCWITCQHQRENESLRKEIALLMQQAYIPAQAPVSKPTPAAEPGKSDGTPAQRPVGASPTPRQTSRQSAAEPSTPEIAPAARPMAFQEELPNEPVVALAEPTIAAANSAPEMAQQPASAPTTADAQLPDTLQKNVAAAVPADSAARMTLQEDEKLPPVPVIDPVKKTLKFKVGPYAVLGFVQPGSKGVSAIQGQGISAEFKLMRHWWLSASAEWLRYEVCAPEFPRNFYPPKDTIPKPPGGNWPGGGGGGPHSKLSLVESHQRMQQFGLGLRYEIPLRWWLRPSVRASYNVVRSAPTLVTFQFTKDDPPTGGPKPKPEFVAEKTPARWQQNQWELGVGLEKDLPRWTFGLWAEYAKSLTATTPSFDAFYVRGGLQYRF